MKVRELIETLRALPPDLDVVLEYLGQPQTIESVRQSTMGEEFQSYALCGGRWEAEDTVCFLD